MATTSRACVRPVRCARVDGLIDCAGASTRATLTHERLSLLSAKRMPVKRVYTPGLLMELSRQDQDAGDELRDLLEKKRLVVTKVRVCGHERALTAKR